MNDRLEIFSETGEYLNQLGVGQLSQPYGIATHVDSLYVSCWSDHTVSKFSLTEMCLVRRIGGEGSDNGQFDFPCQLTTDPIGVFIADNSNDRICIHDPDLNHLRNITHESMSKPSDVKVSRNRQPKKKYAYKITYKCFLFTPNRSYMDFSILTICIHIIPAGKQHLIIWVVWHGIAISNPPNESFYLCRALDPSVNTFLHFIII